MERWMDPIFLFFPDTTLVILVWVFIYFLFTGQGYIRGGWRGRSRGRGRGFVPRNKNTLKFDNDYDFEQANTEFEELRSQLAKTKISEPEVKVEVKVVSYHDHYQLYDDRFGAVVRMHAYYASGRGFYPRTVQTFVYMDIYVLGLGVYV
jgi:hypothetical protein